MLEFADDNPTAVCCDVQRLQRIAPAAAAAGKAANSISMSYKRLPRLLRTNPLLLMLLFMR
jgi:hypothetical protein